MHKRTYSCFIALVILWNLKKTLSASEIKQSDGQSKALNLLLEMLVKSNQDLEDKFERLQETVTALASDIGELKLQRSAKQTCTDGKGSPGRRTENKYCENDVCETLAEQTEEINHKISILEEFQSACSETNEETQETVDEVQERIEILSNGLSSFKVKQLYDEKLFNVKFESMGNQISGLQANHAEVKAFLPKVAEDLKSILDQTEKRLSDFESVISGMDTRHIKEIASVKRVQAEYMEQFVAVQDKAVKSVTDITDLKNKINNVEEGFRAIKDEVIQEIKRDERHNMVSFSARVSPSYSDIQPGTTIIFSNVEINLGQGYNPKTGEFSAPVSGVYVFYSNILTGGNKSIETRLVINGKIKLWLYSAGGQHMGPGSNMLVTHLEKGDIVKMMKYGPWGTKPFYIHHSWSTFSGYLLVSDI